MDLPENKTLEQVKPHSDEKVTVAAGGCMAPDASELKTPEEESKDLVRDGQGPIPARRCGTSPARSSPSQSS